MHYKQVYRYCLSCLFLVLNLFPPQCLTSKVDDSNITILCVCYSIKFIESSDDSDVTTAGNTQYYNDDKELPIHSSTSAGYLAEEIAKVLLNPDVTKVCHVQPMGVTTFTVDIDDVAFSDLKADDLGSWKTNGTKTTYFWIRHSGMIVISSKQKGPDTKS